MAAETRIIPWKGLDAAWRQRWLALWERSLAAPDLSPMWADALVDGHGLEALEPQVLIAGPPDAPQLLWPFLRRSRRQRLGLPIRWIEPLQNTFCMHSGLLGSMDLTEACELIVTTLRAWPQAWDWIDIDCVAAGSALEAAWRQAAAGHGCPLRAQPGERPPFISAPGSFAEFVATRSKNLRKRARGLLRELQSDPTLTLRVFDSAAELPAFIDAVLQIEHQSWKHAAGQSISSRGWELGFYQRLLGEFAPLGALRGAILYVEDQPAAHSIDLLHGQHVYGLKTSYDARFSGRNVGTLILVGMLARYFDGGCTEYDFLGTDEEYKLHWTDAVRQHLSLLLYNPTAAGRFYRLLHEGTRRLRASGPR
jgi:CelD/BcsL family acetyltransferase involved in cellulose biosynthesis